MRRNEAKAQIHAWFEAHRQELIDDLRTLIAVNSIRSEAKPGMPYGEGCARVLEAATRIMNRDGFAVKNFDNHVITTEIGSSDVKLGILAHLDTVSVTENWDSDPFTLRIDGDTLYGRGVSDDKGPAVASYYALRCARELFPELSAGCRLILGAAEETGEPDVIYYETQQAFPPMVFTPDGDYPVVNFEKGRYAPVFGKKFAPYDGKTRIVSVDGGTTPNIVPQTARAVIAGIDIAAVEKAAAALEQKTGVAFTCTPSEDDRITIDARGKSAHASTPELGLNPQTALLELLCALPFEPSPAYDAVQALNSLFPHGDWAGRAAGIAGADEETGALTLNFGVLKLTESEVTANCDIRMPLCRPSRETADTLNANLEKAGLTVLDDGALTSYHYTEPDSLFVKTLLDVYESYTGLKGECLAIGGGTYVHDIPGGVAFGCEMPGYDSRMHGDNERTELSNLLLSGEMFAQAILELCE